MTDTTSNNPLLKHFRQPAIYIKLTSGGKFWKDGSLELPVTGEIPIYPMTAKDEIILRTPDALINGTSVVQVMQSCCPNIKDAWSMPSIDVDSTLIAIRIASYGKEMSVSATCPSCGEEHDYDIDLQNILSLIKAPDYSQSIVTNDGLTINFKPLTYLQVSESGGMSFEEDKLMQALANPGISEDVRKIEFEKHIKNMIELNIRTVSNCTRSIVADGTEVTDAAFIKEYYQNAEGTIIRQVQDKIKEFADAVNIKPVDTLCSACEKQFKLVVEFDYTSFFDKGF